MKKNRLLLFFAFFSFLFIFFTGFNNFYQKEISTNSDDFIKKEKIMVYPSGQSCGIKILSDGVLVISVTDINNSPSPARLSGIEPGDFIKKINDIPIKDSNHFISLVRELGDNKFTIEYERNQVTKKADITAKKSNNEYILGMWVRDSIAGIGTLTFYDINKESFSALGHSICDVDTGEVMPVKDGELVFSKIVSVKKGEKGNPGGLTGVFLENSTEIGKILKNSSYGLSGKIKDKKIVPDVTPIPVGYKKEVSLGKAQIISTINGDNPEYFDVEIIKINKQNKPDIKGMLIKITDTELLEKTGGIIQGMSGSPIIQNGKLIGAVTHVLVNDPTRGYGIFIENMMKEAEIR